MEDTKILTKYKQLESRVQDFIDTKGALAAESATIHARLHIVKDAANDVGTSFNAAEQIQSLHHAQKELDLLISDFLSLQVAGHISETQHQLLVKSVEEIDEVIREMSDPEFN